MQLFNVLFLSPTFITMAINFIRVSPIGSVLSTQPLTYDEDLRNNLLKETELEHNTLGNLHTAVFSSI